MNERAARLKLPLSWRGRAVLVALVLAVIGFGALVVKRSAFSDKPRTDAVVFFRAAWAIRAGEDIYQVTANWWHYHYPPLFAILMTPLADPPPGVDRHAVLPLWASLSVWYVIGIVCAAIGVTRSLGRRCSTNGIEGDISNGRGWRANLTGRLAASCSFVRRHSSP